MPKQKSQYYYIKTFGCQMNVSDSERIAAFLEQRGFSLAKKIQDADLAVFNTCGIKQTAENRAYSMIHNLKTKNQKLGTKIVMTGCLAHRSDVQKRMKKSVDLFCEIKNFTKDFETKLLSVIASGDENDSSNRSAAIPLPQITAQNISSELKTGIATVATLLRNDSDYLNILPKHTNNFQAYIPIMTGCNNFCSYCVVPYARGCEVSRLAEEIIAEVRSLVKQGYKHITLLGQNVNSYRDPHPHLSRVRDILSLKGEDGECVSFSKLLKKLDRIPGKFWISFVSSHPKDFSDELIETVARCKKVCEWIHLPIQAGNDKILEKMNRRYSQVHYLKLLEKIRSKMKKYKPDAPYAISSDIIVGFPSETKKQFLDSAEVMEKAKFDMVFFGQFSPRPGTAAWKMKDNVSQKEKAGREKFLNEILKTTAYENNKKCVGEKLEVLIEKEKNGPVKSGEPDHGVNIYFGKTRAMKNVKIFSNKKDLVGKIVKAEIIKANVWNLEGKI